MGYAPFSNHFRFFATFEKSFKTYPCQYGGQPTICQTTRTHTQVLVGFGAKSCLYPRQNPCQRLSKCCIRVQAQRFFHHSQGRSSMPRLQAVPTIVELGTNQTIFDRNASPLSTVGRSTTIASRMSLCHAAWGGSRSSVIQKAGVSI